MNRTALVVAVALVFFAQVPALADAPELKVGQKVTQDTVDSINSLKFEHDLFHGQVGMLYSYMEGFDKQCGTSTQFKSQACFKKFKAIMEKIHSDPEL